jgi:hypothetical protein
MPEIDFSGVGDQKVWRPAPTGDYILELVDVEEGGTIASGPNAGQPRDTLQFEIVDCEGELEEFNGRRIYENATYTKEGLPKIKSMLRAFGVVVDDSENAEPLKFEWDELLGMKLMANVRSVGERRDKNDPSKTYQARNSISQYIIPKTEE